MSSKNKFLFPVLFFSGGALVLLILFFRHVYSTGPSSLSDYPSMSIGPGAGPLPCLWKRKFEEMGVDDLSSECFKEVVFKENKCSGSGCFSLIVSGVFLTKVQEEYVLNFSCSGKNDSPKEWLFQNFSNEEVVLFEALDLANKKCVTKSYPKEFALKICNAIGGEYGEPKGCDVKCSDKRMFSCISE